MIDAGTLVESVDLKSLIESKSGITLSKAGAEWRGPCPLHGGTNKTAFAVFRGKDGKNRWTCFTDECGSGDALDFIKKFYNVDFVEACKILGGEDADPVEIRKLAEQRAEIAAEELRLAEAKLQAALEDLRVARTWEEYNQNLSIYEKRDLWCKRGIPYEWQQFWQLGYCPAFPVYRKSDSGTIEKVFESESISIPIFGPNWQAMTIRHRLLAPVLPEGVGKYLPERKGLGSHPFMCDPDRPLIGNGTVAIFEGEIKAGVVGVLLDTMKIQILGVAGKKSWVETAEMILDAERIYICFDPDGDKKALEFAEAVGKEKARIIKLRTKIDDAITAGHIDKFQMWRLINNAVHPDYF